MRIPYTVEELVEATTTVIRANGLKSCYIRPIVIRGYGEMGLNPLHAPVDVAIAVWPWGTYLGDEGIKHGVRAKVSIVPAQRAQPSSRPRRRPPGSTSTPSWPRWR